MLSPEAPCDPTTGRGGTDGTDGDEGRCGNEGPDGVDGSVGVGRLGVEGRVGATVGTAWSEGVGTAGRLWPTAGAATMIASPTPKTRPDLNPSSVPELPGPSHSDLTCSVLPSSR
jgi:hypothetical protein